MTDNQNSFLLQWSVKPKWKVYFPSILIAGDITIDNFDIFGVDRGSLDIARNWGKIHSVERFNQGFVAMPEDFTFTVAVKENGEGFEKLRRLGKGAILFDVICDVLKKDPESEGIIVGDIEVKYETEIDGYSPWMKGFEKYVGCLINREGQTVEIGGIPVREFEIVFLQHYILDTTDMVQGKPLNPKILSEGDGTFPTLADLSI